jgi:hypothetical protein
MVVVKTARGLTTRVRFLRGDIDFPRFQEWNALLPDSLKTVNTILML